MNKIAFLEGYLLKLSEEDFVVPAEENADDAVSGILEGDYGVYAGKTEKEKTVENAPDKPKVNSVYADKPTKQQTLAAAITSASKDDVPETMTDSRTGD